MTRDYGGSHKLKVSTRVKCSSPALLKIPKGKGIQEDRNHTLGIDFGGVNKRSVENSLKYRLRWRD